MYLLYRCFYQRLHVFEKSNNSECCIEDDFCSPTHTMPDLEWMLSEKGVLKTTLEENPRKKNQVRDAMAFSIRQNVNRGEDSDSD